MSAPRWEVQIVNPADGKPKTWDVYADRERAESVAATLRQHKFFAQVRRVDDEADPFTSRRRFLVAALMAGWVRPERMTERIVAEIDGEVKA